MQEVPNSIRGQVSVSNYKMKTTFREVIYFFKVGLDSAREDQDCLPFKRQEENQEQEEVRLTNISTKIMELKSYLILVHFGTPPHYLGQ